MAVSAVKREAVGLYEQLAAAEARKEELQVRDAVKNVLADFFLNGQGGYPPTP